MLPSIPQPPPRPASPTELSYTQLAKLAPRFGAGGRGIRNNGAGIISTNDNQHQQFYTPSASTAMPPKAQPRTAPPATIHVPIGNGIDGDGSMSDMQQNYQTPAPTQILHNNINHQQPTQIQMMSAPMSYYTHHSINNNMPGMINEPPVLQRSTPVEDRLSNLATKLHTMQQTSSATADPSNLHTQMINNLQHSSQQQQQSTSRSRLNEVQQFIETLKNMQMAVSKTQDEHQRVKKSRALCTLLSMFERIIEDTVYQKKNNANNIMDPSDEMMLVQQLDERVQQLEEENSQLQSLCQEKDGQLHRVSNVLQTAQLEVQQLQHVAKENEQLKAYMRTVQQQCQQERQRATEAQGVACESENVRDGMLANYAQLTEENVELHQAMEDVKVQQKKMIAEYELCQQEMNAMKSQVDQLTQQLQQKDLDIITVEQKMGDINDQLIAQQNLLQSANNDRQRLQDELHNSQRNSTTASQQLMNLRGQFSQFRRESNSRQSQTRRLDNDDSEQSSIVQSKLQEEQQPQRGVLDSKLQDEQSKRILEMALSKTNSRDSTEQDEEIQRVSEVNDDLKAKVDELNAQLNIVRPRSQRSSSMTDEFSLVDSIMDNHLAGNSNDGNDGSPLSMTTSHHTGMSNDTIAREGLSSRTNADEINERLVSSPDRQANHLSAIDELSLDDSVMNVHDIENSNAQGQGHSMSRKEDEHPNLMDYFYNQLKLAE